MIRMLAAGAAALALASSAASAEEPTTTRIVPYNAYGATVSIEQGVRVFRPLPADGHVIVNPGNRTPMSVNIYDGAVPVVPSRR